MKQKRIKGSLLFILTGILTLFCLNPAMAAGKMLGNNYEIDLRAGEAVFDTSEASLAMQNTFWAMDNNGVIGHDTEKWGWDIYDLNQDEIPDLAYKSLGEDSAGMEWFSLSVQNGCKIHGLITLTVNNETKAALNEDGYDYYEKLTFRFPEAVPVSIAGVSVTGIANKEYTGKPITQTVTVKLYDIVLREGIHYTVSYKDNTAPGTATLLLTGMGACTGTATKTFQITKTAADNVSDTLLALKSADALTLADKAAVTAARQAYSGLSEGQRSLVTADRLKKLTDAESRIAALEKAEAEAKAAQEAAAKAAQEAAAKEAAQKAAAVKKAQTVVKGKVYTVSGLKYKVTNPSKKGKGTVTLIGTTKKKSKLQTLNIPATVKINGVTLKVTAVGNNAFQKYTKLRTVAIGKNVRTIGKNAFFKCSRLKTIVIKTTKLTAKTIGANAFKGIYKKAKVKVPKTKLKSYAALLKKRGIGKSAKFTR